MLFQFTTYICFNDKAMPLSYIPLPQSPYDKFPLPVITLLAVYHYEVKRELHSSLIWSSFIPSADKLKFMHFGWYLLLAEEKTQLEVSLKVEIVMRSKMKFQSMKFNFINALSAIISHFVRQYLLTIVSNYRYVISY